LSQAEHARVSRFCACYSSKGYVQPIRREPFALASPSAIWSWSVTLSSFEGQRSEGTAHGRRAYRFIDLIAGLALIAVATDGCNSTILSTAGPIAEGESLILLDALGIMLVIVVPTILATLFFAWWFRASNRAAAYLPTWAYSGKLEVLVWAIPALVVLFLGGVAWIGSHELDPARPIVSSKQPLEIEVVSLDWRWLFIYPKQGIATINQLVVPVGTPVHFKLTSASVMNVFFVPRLAGQIYTMNGMVTQLNLLADRTGTFPGISAQFSGDGFAGMSFDTVVATSGQFAAFVERAHAAPDRLDDAEYRLLSQQSHDSHVQMFGYVSAGLFEDIANLKLPPGSGPMPLAPVSDTQVGGR
jgi:cytochrome o ubiquinol oxidase subunit II